MSAEVPEASGLSHGEASEVPSPLRDAFDRLRRASREGCPSSCHERRVHLERLGGVIRARTADIVEAIRDDFGHRSTHETLLSEVHLTLSHLRFVRRKLGRWMRPRRCAVSLPFLPARARIHLQPLGVVGIISPWNYPFQLAMLPFIEALAAGNRVLLKPSEISPRMSEILRRIVETALEPSLAAVVTGGPEVGAAFCRLPFDHLLFTGSTAVGRSVLAAASSNLTPVTLELGG
ncbi:MAG: aldehyde dehydrogenase family protein, partial [Planctomycetes bacterium]|nr:aldehyde dehydrogenase family protein [Planctomycetota bacterium]